MKKALFFDIDGTLMYGELGENIIPEAVKTQLQRLKQKGHYIFIASGRPIAFVSKQITDLNFDGYVLCNGAHVEIHGQRIFEKPIAYEDMVSLKKLLDGVDCEYDFETATNCYIDKNFVHFDTFFRQCDINNDMLLHDFDEQEVMHRTLKVEISAIDCKQEIEKHIAGKFRYDTHGTQNSFEICSQDVSKAKGIAMILEHLHISTANCYAFGDGVNDLEMIQFAGHGIAMKNAVDSLKAVADEVIGDVKENGLADYLQTIQ